MITLDELGLPDHDDIETTGESILKLADALVDFGFAITKAAYPGRSIQAMRELSRDTDNDQ